MSLQVILCETKDLLKLAKHKDIKHITKCYNYLVLHKSKVKTSLYLKANIVFYLSYHAKSWVQIKYAVVYSLNCSFVS